MGEFDNRGKAFEKKFELDEDLKFKIAARAARLLGQWAAGQMGLTGSSSESYAQSVVEADLSEKGTADILNKVEADIKAKGVVMSRYRIEKEFATFESMAHDQYTKFD